ETLFDGLVDRMVPLGECVRFINGRAYKKDELLSAGKYRVLRVGNFFSNDSWYFSDLELDADKYCHEGDLLYAWSASFGPRIWHGDKTIFHYHIWKLSFDKTLLNRDYLLHFLDYDSRAIESSTSVTNSTMMHVSMAQMKKRLFPLPNIEVQEAVADKLNSISSLANALRSERDARRKQFAYYRDKLLAFPELTRKADK
ncbi:MAG: restriction endonuclease subunit S, partial [Atopobiaceae bacterium]|nr:restriction endonuclease subunit S [Atopobiaceae bacterium]